MDLLDKEILLVDKPAGMSSFAVVARIRRVLTKQVREKAASLGQGASLPKRVKVGHAGTLDPFATGLLICLLGRVGTKRAAEFLKLDKKYEATIKLGEVSTTGDVEGEISAYNSLEAPVARLSLQGAPYRFCPSQKRSSKKLYADISRVDSSRCRKRSPEKHIADISQVKAVVEAFRGEILQKVPAYSAVKIDGRRAYDLARKGVKVEMPVRKVQIYDISVVDYKWPYLKIACHVSSGTYIRALGEDIGAALGVGGYLTELRRTEIGNYSVADAVKLEDVMREDL